MKKKLDKFANNRLFIIILIVVLGICTILVGTYAWFTWSSDDNTTFVMTIGDIADVYFTEGNSIEGNLYPTFNYVDGLSTSFDIVNKTTLTGGTYNICFNIDYISPELINEQVKIVVIKGSQKVKEIDLLTAEASNNSTITLYNSTFTTGTVSYKIYLYMDGNKENNLNMIGKNIKGNILVTTE